MIILSKCISCNRETVISSIPSNAYIKDDKVYYKSECGFCWGKSTFYVEVFSNKFPKCTISTCGSTSGFHPE